MKTTTANKRKAKPIVEPNAGLPSICSELQAMQRQRAIYTKSRIMVANRLQALIAGTIGYCSGMKEAERRKVFTEAGKLIKEVIEGKVASAQHGLIMTHHSGIAAFDEMRSHLEKEMKALAKQLPASKWVEQPEQRGFGLLFLAIVIGETGDLNNYANPAKVWRRLGCAPWSHDGQTLMGATWRSGKHGKLPAEQWESFGYSPRRRSIAFLIGEGIVKQNGNIGGGDGDICDDTDGLLVGPYRQRYDAAKLSGKANHPDWSDLRAHRHGMLLATKLLLKNLWVEWTQ